MNYSARARDVLDNILHLHHEIPTRHHDKHTIKVPTYKKHTNIQVHSVDVVVFFK